MGRSKSSHRWMQRHVNDEYVKRSQKDGYRSRAAYKLLELQEKDRFLKPGQVVVDLGAAPGGWLQVARSVVGGKGRVIGLDLLEIDPLPGVELLQGDFLEEATLARLETLLDGRPVDVVLSDMAPNISGIAAVDQPRSMYLCELALDFCRQALREGGAFVTKVFQGEGFDDYYRDVKASFRRVVSRKPKASRPKSREVYLVAGNYHS
ncbi:23S rRNA (uridine(2552)-2'-O)-methyltransferase RlmE [endosymbiont of unidentified scaly snail isolate Monju]|uniref:23S rRNA (uridine(2552)-2'-O)-methyltransferase RlmE n=1 Tax=endosymbiont of unidentified scaly snail isolate Monju TaxID=1248727 RepID=UPI0005BD7C40|nr:23S rRNA (uridine(2552)-2'-O)-methyltransferase RlmE [endosymbiont of unidentified scaly snail isolate Monju]